MAVFWGLFFPIISYFLRCWQLYKSLSTTPPPLICTFTLCLLCLLSIRAVCQEDCGILRIRQANHRVLRRSCQADQFFLLILISQDRRIWISLSMAFIARNCKEICRVNWRQRGTLCKLLWSFVSSSCRHRGLFVTYILNEV